MPVLAGRLVKLIITTRSTERPNHKTAAGMPTGQTLTSKGDIFKPKSLISDTDPNLQLDVHDFPNDANSTILVHERARVSETRI